MWTVNRQLCAFREWQTFLTVLFWFLTGLRAGKTVGVVVLLAMDFWNCRVSFHEPRPPTND
jgi:hypothetical protein